MTNSKTWFIIKLSSSGEVQIITVEECYWQEMSYRKYVQNNLENERSLDDTSNDEEAGGWLEEFGADDYSEESMP